jgi:diguanylate cyclase (GGDEF)-like protein/PAS domain S-box-containing protein
VDQKLLKTLPRDNIAGSYADTAIVFATSLLENANDLVAAIDTDLRFVGLNAAFRREFELVFGRPVELGQRLDEALGHLTGDRDKAMKLCRRALAGESFRVIEEFGDEQLLRKAYELAFSPIFDTYHQAVMAAIVVRDVTMLRLSEQRFGALLEAAPDAMIIIRSDGVIDLANTHAERLFHYGRHQLTGLSVEMLLPERFRLNHVMQRQQFNEQPSTRPMGKGRVNLLGLRFDGSEFPVEISLNPLDVGGEKMVVGAIRDMTMRQRSEDRLRELSAELEQRVADRTTALEQANYEYRTTFEQAAVGMAQVALDGRWLHVNQALCEIVGYSQQEMLELTSQDITHPDDIDANLKLVQQVLSGNIPSSSFMLEKRYLHKNGTVVWTSLNASLVRDSTGTAKYFISVINNIDDRKRAEQALRESERRYTALFNNKTNAINHLSIVTDEQGLPVDCIVEKINDAYEQVTGIKKENIEGRKLTDVFPGIEHFEFDLIGTYGKIALEGGEASFEVYFTYLKQWLSVYAYSPQRGECTVLFTDVTASKLAEAALRESEAQLRATFEQAAVGIAHISIPERRFLRVNQTFCRIVGYDPDELLALTVSDLTHPDDLKAYEKQYAQLISGQLSSFTMEKRYIRKDGSVIWVRKTFSAVRDEHGSPVYGISVLEDITDEKHADLARQEMENRLQLAVSIANLGFWEWDVAANEIYFSVQWKKQLGYQDHELPNGTKEWLLRLHPEDRDRVVATMADFIAKPTADFRLEYRLRHRDGSYRAMLTSANAMTASNGQVVKLIGTQLDVTESKLAEQRVLEAAQHDPLTGLPNRALVFEYASHLLAAVRRNPRRGAFLFIDLDRFKPINDLYGHGVGDRLLQEAASRLVSCVRDEDLVGRLGGDEFVIMLPQINGQPATTVARHVMDALSRPFQIDEQDLSISASIGISHFPEHGTDVDALIHAADLAMYQAKQGGRANYHVYTSTLSDRADAASSIEAQLKRALKHGGLALHYQPVVDMRSRRVIGVEALLRLASEGGLAIPPDRFIPVAEAAGLIGELGEWVAIEACRQHLLWRDQGLPPITIAINVSPLQFRQRSFAQRLQSILQDAHMEPACFQIEVTESAVMDSVDEAIDTLKQIKSIGIKIALDDFGTGYSSLSHLSRLPLDKLKVDQSFVKILDHDRNSRAITGAIITLGRTLNLEVVGEGIESEFTLDYLQENGCDQAQGFFISQPLLADDFANWYQTERSRRIVR